MNNAAIVYAIENEWNKTKKNTSFTEYFAKKMGQMIASAALKKISISYEIEKNRFPELFGEDYKGCDSVEQAIATVLLDAMWETRLSDSVLDVVGDMIDKNANAIIKNHPEILESEESFYFE